MRHLLGLLFGVLLAPVIYFLTALGHYRFLDALQRFADDSGKLPAELAFGAILIVAAGAWLGALLSSRLSPLAPAVAGLAWLGLGAAFVADIDRVNNLLPNGPAGQQGMFALPLEHGYVFLVGTALLSPLFSPARWRGKPKQAAAAELAEEPPVESEDTPVEESGRYPRPVRADDVRPGHTTETRPEYATGTRTGRPRDSRSGEAPGRTGYPPDAPRRMPSELSETTGSYRGSARVERDSTTPYRGSRAEYREPVPGRREQSRSEPRLPWEDEHQPRH